MRATFRRLTMFCAVTLSLTFFTLNGGVELAGALPATPVVSVIYVGTYDTIHSLTADSSGNLYGVDWNTGSILEFSGDFGTARVLATDPVAPIGITYHNGVLYVSNYNGSIDTVPAVGGTLTTLIATPSVVGSEAGGSEFAFDSVGDVFIANYANDVIAEVRAGATTEVTTGIRLPTNCGPWGLSIEKTTLYITCYDGSRLEKATVPGPTTQESATLVTTPPLATPGQIAQDSAGNQYFTSYGNNRIFKIAATTSSISQLKVQGTTLYKPWATVWSNGSLYVGLYSSPNLIAKIPLPSQFRVITCVKGASTLHVSGVNPICPSGYKLK